MDDPSSPLKRAADQAKKTGNEIKEVTEDAKGAATEITSAFEGVSETISQGLVTSLKAVALEGKGVSEVFRSLAIDVSGKVLDAALSPVQTAIGGAVSGFLGNVLPFARGGVVSGPTLFPTGGGAGLMGEAGPEAILPLQRGADGRLGVAAPGGSGPSITVNIQTPDAESFRRSRGQVAADLARAVARGSRNL